MPGRHCSKSCCGRIRCPKEQADQIVQGEVLIGVEIYGSDGATPETALVEILPLGE